ncbi:MAG: DUF559 domain-containing protein [Microthrixaceae bacterium]|nr:DUF559 domain-containing protein [Microthrixaceae bacterium]
MASDPRLRDLRTRQNGVASRSQVRALGLSAKQIRRRLNDGDWQPLGAALVLSPGPITYVQRCRAATLTIGGVISHHSAGLLLRLPGLAPGAARRARLERRPLAVTVPHRHRTSSPLVEVHVSAGVVPGRHVESVPVTSPERTIVDLAGTESANLWQRVLDMSLASGAADHGACCAELERVAHRGRRGVRDLRRELAARTRNEGSESELERRMIELLRHAGITPPEQQYQASWGRVDLAWLAERVAVELDSRSWHQRRHDFARDRRRDQQAAELGWTVLRFTWEDVTNDPERVVATIRAVLG